jgi:hypothetical protein
MGAALAHRPSTHTQDNHQSNTSYNRSKTSTAAATRDFFYDEFCHVFLLVCYQLLAKNF